MHYLDNAHFSKINSCFGSVSSLDTSLQCITGFSALGQSISIVNGLMHSPSTRELSRPRPLTRLPSCIKTRIALQNWCLNITHSYNPGLHSQTPHTKLPFPEHIGLLSTCEKKESVTFGLSPFQIELVQELKSCAHRTRILFTITVTRSSIRDIKLPKARHIDTGSEIKDQEDFSV